MKENPFHIISMEIIYLEETDSTNNYMKRLLAGDKKPEEGTIVAARSQTAGRGQNKNRWESEPDKNLTFSLLLFPGVIPVNQQFLLSQITALGIVDFLSSFCRLTGLSVKWPNDIYWNDQKICGILIENLLSPYTISHTIIGVGINMNQTVFRSDAPNPVSAKQITGEEYDLNAALHSVGSAILNRYMQLLSDKKELIRNDYFSALYRRNGYFSYKDKNGLFSAHIKKIKDSGLLILETADGEERNYAFKEVEFVN